MTYQPHQSEDVSLKTAPCSPDCSDKDEDCPGIEDKVNCWLYAPERGMCPFLRSAAEAKNP